MKKVKKWAALGLAAVMVLSMTACGGSGGDSADGGGRFLRGKQQRGWQDEGHHGSVERKLG